MNSSDQPTRELDPTAEGVPDQTADSAPGQPAEKTTIKGSIEDLIVPPLESGKAYLIVIRGRSVGRMQELGDDAVVLGRAGESDFALDDPGVSRRHARIERDGAQYVLADMGSTNGLLVNGSKVEKQRLSNGDRIRLGATVLKFCFQDEVEETFQRRLYDAATRDALLGIFNRRYFDEALVGEFAHARRHAAPLSLLLLDLDHFKQVNDTAGHLAGDHALREVAACLARGLRTENILARYGGEEFVILLRHVAVEGAMILAERLRAGVESLAVTYAGRSFALTVSIGVALFDGKNLREPRELVGAADTALLEAKKAGRNRVVGPSAQRT